MQWYQSDNIASNKKLIKQTYIWLKMDHFRKRFQSGFEKVRHYSLSLVSGERDKIFNIEAEDTYCRDIIFSMKKLEQIAALTTEEKVACIRHIGIVSWTGSPLALKKAGSYLEKLIGFFSSESLEIKIEIIKAISQICRLNAIYQDIVRNVGFLKEMVETLYIEQDEMVELQKWMIYCITCMLVENPTNQKFILSVEDFQEVLSQYQTETWYTWNQNEANYLLNILYFK